MAEIDDFHFPTEAEAMDLIGPDRRPYAIARESLNEEGVARNRLTKLAIRSLHKAQTDGVLSPPLSEPLAEAIARADSYIDEYGIADQTRGFKYPVGAILLSAVFEHGYRSID